MTGISLLGGKERSAAGAWVRRGYWGGTGTRTNRK